MGRFVSLGFSLGETTVTSNNSPPFSFGSRFTFLRWLLDVRFFGIQFTCSLPEVTKAAEFRANVSHEQNIASLFRALAGGIKVASMGEGELLNLGFLEV
jgi:hypothetical protein